MNFSKVRQFLSSLLKPVKDLSYDLVSKLLDAYVRWYKIHYGLIVGDLIANTRPLFVNGDSRVFLYDGRSSELIQANTPMLCIHVDATSYVVRCHARDITIPLNLIVYFKTVSKA